MHPLTIREVVSLKVGDKIKYINNKELKDNNNILLGFSREKEKKGLILNKIYTIASIERIGVYGRFKIKEFPGEEDENYFLHIRFSLLPKVFNNLEIL